MSGYVVCKVDTKDPLYLPPPPHPGKRCESLKKISLPPLLPSRCIIVASRRRVFASFRVRLFGWLLHCRAVSRRSRCLIASFRRVATPRCAALGRHLSSSRLVVTTRRLVVSLSCLVLPRRCVAPPCASHHTCFVRLVVASSRCVSSLLPLARLVVATCHCVARCCRVASRLVVALRLVITSRRVVFCRRVWFSWLSRFLPSASRRTTSRRRDALVAVRFHIRLSLQQGRSLATTSYPAPLS